MCNTSFQLSSLIMLLLMIIVLSFKSANCIECFDCVSVSSISDCHQTKVCPWDHYCFTYKIVFGDHTKFSLGCRSTQDCLSSLTATSDDLECSQCCAADSCNANLCANGKHVVNTSVCEDDPDYNCQSTVDVCSDINHAERVCRKFCGICKIVHGQWSMWSSWGSCSVTCGIGLQIRDRSCSNPLPGPGGDQCNGDTQEDRLCFLGHCADGAWSSWSAWSTCSASCLGGISERTRLCNHPAPSPLGHGCYGNDNDIKTCNAIECPVVNGEWSTWKQWGSCSVTCDIGTKKRTRTCTNPTPSTFGKVCIGNSEENDICNSQSCQDIVVDGHWSSWTNWGICPVNCGVGTKTRTRTCNNPSPSGSGKACSGNSEDKDVCNTQSCSSSVRLVDGAYVYEGRLEVYHNGVWGTVCDDSFNEISATVVCNMLNYPGNNIPRVYSEAHFGPGTLPILLDEVKCTGTETSLFDCKHAAWGSHDCKHSEDVGISCITMHGGWSVWSSWGSCSVTCGIGVKIRERNCSNPSPGPGGDQCNGDTQEDRLCFLGPCAVVNGDWSSWNSWGSCSLTCGIGTKERTRTCTNPPPSTYGKVCIGNSKDRDVCNNRICPSLWVRLVGGSSSHRGRVEVSVDGSNWGTVCDDSFSNNSAKVVCRMLGYPASNARMDKTVSHGSGNIYLDDVICTGTEWSLTYCLHRDWGKHNCVHHEDVGVICA